MKPLLTKLTAWKKTDEDEEFVDKAIDSLYKKLKTKPGAIEELQRAINNPTVPSQCITIPRSLDGRLQVSHRKGLPHVIYCRIFRWPDLQTPHELRAIDSCEYSFSSKQSEVCVNPYHYERIDIPVLPPVLVPKYVEFSQGHSVVHQQFQQPLAQSQYASTCQGNAYAEPVSAQSTHSQAPSSDYQTSAASLSINNFRSNINYNYHYYYNNSMNMTNQTLNTSASFQSSDSPNNVLEESSESICNLSPVNSSHANSSNSNSRQTSVDGDSQLIHYQEPAYWCSIVYYELNVRVGEVFNASSNDIFVDGYTNPCNNFGRRFCLGMFSNINRNTTIENCRKHIGRGVHLYNDNGDIYVECLSESPIFIQSRNCNLDCGFHPNTVCKLPSGYSLRIFQSKLFAKTLRTSIEHGYDAVYDLSNMCVIKLSFVKGWGADYYRQDVSSCPCWIEIRLNGAFQWLDKVLKEMGSCTNPVTSVS